MFLLKSYNTYLCCLYSFLVKIGVNIYVKKVVYDSVEVY